MTNDKQRERLVELIIASVNGCARNWAEVIADYLLANGVIVPPCKVGDIIWIKNFERDPKIQEAEVTRIMTNKYGTYICYEYPAFRGREYVKVIKYIGKTVFLTKKEAEEALGGVQG